MKLQSSRSASSGTVLVTMLCIAGVLTFALGSYMKLIASVYRSTVRSQYWNCAIPAAEAGLEEAMAHMNKNCLSNNMNGGVLDWTGDGVWTQVSDGVALQRSLPDGSRFDVIIINTTPSQPEVLAQGYVPTYGTTFTVGIPVASSPFALGGVAQDTGGINYSGSSWSYFLEKPFTSKTEISRKVSLRMRVDSLIAKGLVAKGTIDLSGNNVKSDSFDSENPAFSTGGKFIAGVTPTKDNGDIATNSGLDNSLAVGNANLKGHVATGPGGSVSIGPNGSVGDSQWVDNGNTGIQDGHVSDDMNVSFPDVLQPEGNFFTPTGGTFTNIVVTTNYSSNTFATYPPNPVGQVITNTTLTATAGYPAAGTYVGVVATNFTQQTASSIPAGAYQPFTTNIAGTTTATYPSPGTYIGPVATNTIPTTTVAYPGEGTYLGVVSTNTGPVTTVTYPSSPIGSVTTNTTLTTTDGHPGTGTYIGIITTNWQTKTKIRDYTYRKITGYTANQVTGYSYTGITGYFCTAITGYSYWAVTGYSYSKITSYSAIAITSYTTNKTTKSYDYILGDGQYEVKNLSGSVLVTGHALLLTESINIKGQGGIEIRPNASLRLYAASSVALGGNGVMNESGNANQFYLYGLPSCTDISMTGNGAFTGVIYAPSADFKLGGGGNDAQDFVGAAIVNAAKLNGHFNFHYDEALSRNGPARGFVIQEWQER